MTSNVHLFVLAQLISDVRNASILSFNVHKCCQTISEPTNVVQFRTYMNKLAGILCHCLADGDESFLVMSGVEQVRSSGTNEGSQGSSIG